MPSLVCVVNTMLVFIFIFLFLAMYFSSFLFPPFWCHLMPFLVRQSSVLLPVGTAFVEESGDFDFIFFLQEFRI